MTALGVIPNRAGLGESVVEALSNLYAQRQRSVLALLGILIGTASIIAMLTIGHMAQRETLQMFNAMGVDIVQVQAAPIGSAPARLDRRTLENMPSRLASVVDSTGMSIGVGPIAANGQSVVGGILVAVTPDLPRLTGLRVVSGRFIKPLDDGSLVAVVGAELAGKLSSPGAPLTLGSQLRVKTYVYTVVGLLQPTTYTALDPADYNNAVLIPMTGSRRVLDAADPTLAIFRIHAEADPKSVGEQASVLLANPSSALTVRSARELIESMNAAKAVHSRLLAAIGAISLLVGGIGVMNVMLMGVMERRREIGLRAAIGATPRDLQLMFLVEAVTLALFGGVAGVVFGLLVAALAAKASGWSFSLPLYVLPLGPGVAAVVGVVFGLYPAIKASRLDPIEALRAE